MLLNFKESSLDSVVIETEFIEEDLLVVRSLYENIELPQDNIKQKLIFFLRNDFYGVEFTVNIEQYFSKVTPSDIEILIEYYDILPQISNILVKYISLFIIDIPNIDQILDKLYIINKQIVYDIIDTLFDKMCLCSSRMCFQRYFSKSLSRVNVERIHFISLSSKFITETRYSIPNKLYHRDISHEETVCYSYLPKIQSYVVFWMPHVGIARLMFKYQYFNQMNKINFAAFNEAMKKDAFGECNDIDFIKNWIRSSIVNPQV
jgi:hypothetical protein